MPAITPNQPWLWPIDGEVRERLEWLTDVREADDGSEQRNPLRRYPRRSLEYRYQLSGRARREAENRLWDNQSATWAVPVWMDAQRLATSLEAGDSAISLDAEYRDYAAGGSVVLMTSPQQYEVAEIASVAVDSLSLTAPLTGDWPAGLTTVAPLRYARLPSPLRLVRFDGDTVTSTLPWQLIDNSDWPAADESEALYRGYPVLASLPDWQQDLSADYARAYEELDSLIAQPVRDRRAGALQVLGNSYSAYGRAEIDRYRRWLYARQGRAKAYWLPSFARDVQLVADAADVATTLDIEACGYADGVSQDIGRRDLRIVLLDGTVILRRVTASAVLSADVERLSLSGALGVAVAVANVAAISWLSLVRLDSDTAELRWWTHDVVNLPLTSRGLRNDL